MPFHRFLLIMAAVATLGCQSGCSRETEPGEATSLVVFCAAGMKQAVEAIAEDYRKQAGVEVALHYGGTGTLLSQLRVARRGDLFIAADESSLADAARLDVVRDSQPLVVQHPVLAVARGNPKRINSLQDLFRAEVRLALANPEAASIGRVCQKLLGPQWQQLTGKAVVMKMTVTEIAMDVAVGAADAALVWDSVVPQFPQLQLVHLPEVSQHAEHASVAKLTFSSRPKESADFVAYLLHPSHGSVAFARFGLTPVIPAKLSPAAEAPAD